MLALKPIPATPTHCRACARELPPLRRWGGLCEFCVVTHRAPPLTDPLERDWTIVQTSTRRRANGELEACMRIRCRCGTERLIAASAWRERRSSRCNRCRMRRERRGTGGLANAT
jgi:hypothetical protein